MKKRKTIKVLRDAARGLMLAFLRAVEDRDAERKKSAGLLQRITGERDAARAELAETKRALEDALNRHAALAAELSQEREMHAVTHRALVTAQKERDEATEAHGVAREKLESYDASALGAAMMLP